jgi:quinolinate synthase
MASYGNATNAPFPSIVISKDGLSAQGPFAEAQATFLYPDSNSSDALRAELEKTNMGVVAHFYMDSELQGVLADVATTYPHIAIADSLVMGQKAVEMVEAGATSVVCLGVDFMAENCRAALDAAGLDAPVYRVDEKAIGCSLSESAETLAYTAYLEKAKETKNALHVIYINTSLKTKAMANEAIPTITCTSSNVVRVVLTAFAQAAPSTCI